MSSHNGPRLRFLFPYDALLACPFCVLKRTLYHLIIALIDESDRPPVADGGPDRVVQPQDTVTLNGHKSRDDVEIASYLWTMITAYPFAIIEVSEQIPNLIWPPFWKLDVTPPTLIATLNFAPRLSENQL